MKIWNLFKISQVKKILRKAHVFSWFFDSWGFTGLHSWLQFTTSKNAKETCAFLKIFLGWNFLNRSHIFPPFPGSKNAGIITHIFKVFWSIFWIGRFWDVCSVVFTLQFTLHDCSCSQSSHSANGILIVCGLYGYVLGVSVCPIASLRASVSIIIAKVGWVVGNWLRIEAVSRRRSKC